MRSESSASEYQELLAGYVLGDLTPEELTQVQNLLRQDPAVDVEIQALQEALGALPLGLDVEEPPAPLKARILEAAGALPQTMAVEHGGHPKPRRSLQLKWGRLITGLAVTGAIALGVQNWQLRQQLAQTPSYKIAITSEETLPREAWQSFSEVLLDHQNSLTRSQGPVDFATQDVAEVRSQYSQRISLSTNFPELSKAKLLGGSFCELSKTQGIRLSYKVSAGKMISFYQLKRQGFSLDISETPMPIQVFEGPNGLVWGDQDYVYVLVGEVAMPTMRQLMRSLRSV